MWIPALVSCAQVRTGNTYVADHVQSGGWRTSEGASGAELLTHVTLSEASTGFALEISSVGGVALN